MTVIARVGSLCALVLLLGVDSVAAQAAGSAKTSAEPAAADTNPQAKPAKKKGLFGKVKSLAGDKTVQQVAKTAACTMVPGGQAIVGAIDAASTKDAGAAASGAATASGGASCMPGGIGGAATAGSGVAGMATQAAGAKAAAGRSTGVAGYGTMPGLPEGAMGAGAMEGMPSEDEIAKCMGLSTEDYLDLTDPTRGVPRQLTKNEMKRQAKLAKKVDMRRYQACMMQAVSIEE